MNKKDPLTGQLFTPRRNNQEFATRTNQIRFNNLKAAKKRKAKSSLDKVLDKNRNIIIAVLGNKNEVVRSKEFLLGSGFNFSCLTHNLIKEDIIYHCIYDFAYIKIDESKFKLLRNVAND